ncbi:MAG: phosphatase PAP2 family protein [Planctomycetota bacterium]
MTTRPSRSTAVAASALPLVVLLALSSCRRGEGAPGVSKSAVLHWNQVAYDASGLDHTPEGQGPAHDFGDQLGPCRASRAMAIVHLAMFEAVNAIHGTYSGYAGVPSAPSYASPEAALAQAARDTLVALFPSQVAIFDAELESALLAIVDGPAEDLGVAVGKLAAQTVLDLRSSDGSAHDEPLVGVDFFCSDDPGRWRPDPIGMHEVALGGSWPSVVPWTLLAAEQFRAPAPPDTSMPEYAAAFQETYELGGDGDVTPTLRTDEQTHIGIFWAYDGTPSLCAPPRLYNQITSQLAVQRGTSGYETLRLLATMNMALADAAIAIWESKYFHDYWRPVCAIREAEVGTGPTGLGDGNPSTVGDPTFTPLGAPASNLSGPNFTPPFPTYPSGHAGFGGALFQVLRRFYGTDDVAFTFVSDEFNGVTVDDEGNVRPYLPRHFTNFSEAEEENGRSRIYLGIHWYFDSDEGIALGRRVGDWVYDGVFHRL